MDTRQQSLFEAVNQVARLAETSKLGRLLHQPAKYLFAILHRQFLYPFSKKEIYKTTPLFFGQTMVVALPSSIDIYLTGGKSHPSEIRLARFLIQNLRDKDHFLDIGGHYGYFTVLGAELVGEGGRVVSVEASPKNFSILKQNGTVFAQIKLINKAVTDIPGKTINFYEFPNEQSEYDSFDITQYESQDWFKNNPPRKIIAETITVDKIIDVEKVNPAVIKIDVEGAESLVVKGATEFLQSNAPLVVMEYVSPKRKNNNHKMARSTLEAMGYRPFLIQSDGALEPVKDIDEYLEKSGLESDNIVFKKAS